MRLVAASLTIRSASSKVSGSISSWLTDGASTRVATLRTTYPRCSATLSARDRMRCIWSTVAGARPSPSRARGARRAPADRRSWASAARRCANQMRGPERGAAPARHRAGLPRERCAPGRRLPLLGPPGHGGVGARLVPRGPPHGLSAATISARRANCKGGPSSRRSSVKPGKITRKSASRHT